MPVVANPGLAMPLAPVAARLAWWDGSAGNLQVAEAATRTLAGPIHVIQQGVAQSQVVAPVTTGTGTRRSNAP